MKLANVQSGQENYNMFSSTLDFLSGKQPLKSFETKEDLQNCFWTDFVDGSVTKINDNNFITHA